MGRVKQSSDVVPANAGTHTLRPLVEAPTAETFLSYR